MKKLRIVLSIFGLLALSYFGAMIFRNMSVDDELTEIKTDHFVISYHGILKTEVTKLADALENNYERIRSDLKDTNHQTIRVFVHPTQDDFNKGTGLLHSKANGTSRGPNEFHFIWTNWFNSIFPNDPVRTAIHELVHCVQLNILITKAKDEFPTKNGAEFDKAFEDNFITHYPQWFWEAISDYEAGIVNTISVRYGMTSKPTLAYLNKSDHVYNVGYTIIEYIVGKWSKEKLPLLITSYVDIENVLGVSESEFEKGWIEYVNEHY